MTIEQFLDQCAGQGYDAAVFREFRNLWAISVNERSPSMPGPKPRRRYATGKTWPEALSNWEKTGWNDRDALLKLMYGVTQEVGV